MENSKIQWTHSTFNPVRGCTKVSEGCRFCYAEAMSARNPAVLGEWGPRGRRALAAESYWRQPLRWNREALAAGERHRVFCASLADVFEDRPELEPVRERLWQLVPQTPALDWLLLTKRPEVMLRWAEEYGWPSNAWAGVSVENQSTADARLPILAEVPAPVRWLSLEPLLESVDLAGAVRWLDWIVIGGESGPHARPFDLRWARALLRQTEGTGCRPFVKQLGFRAQDTANGIAGAGVKLPQGVTARRLTDRKGGDMAEWPADLRVRQFPAAGVGL